MSWFSFNLGLNLIFIFFWGREMYGNEFETKEIKFKPKIKLNHNIHMRNAALTI